MAVTHAGDLRLIRDVAADRPQAWERFVGRIADTVWTACLILEGDEMGARDAFALTMAGLRADGFRRLRDYDGSSRIETFVILLTREILIERLLGNLVQGRRQGWPALEHFFAADIRRIVARRFPGADHDEARHDAYQEICLRLVEDDFRRLRAYQGAGSFGGFVLHMVDRLAIDIVRRTLGRGENTAKPQPVHLDGVQWENLSCPGPSPEQCALDAEEGALLTRVAAILTDLIDTLPASEALYLRIALDGAEPLPARDIARLMGRPVAEVYKIKQKVMVRLHDILSEHPMVKKWRESV
ncbi:MAG: sigma-70 family RNA polymerase sigma factor [Bacteroidota bacterium]